MIVRFTYWGLHEIVQQKNGVGYPNTMMLVLGKEGEGFQNRPYDVGKGPKNQLVSHSTGPVVQAKASLSWLFFFLCQRKKAGQKCCIHTICRS